MNKYSVVIPTMFKSHRTEGLLKELAECDAVDEIIVIDNSGDLEPRFPQHPKYVWVCEGKNTGCNPAWNKGVSLAKNEQVSLVSDDINFDSRIFHVIGDDILAEYGLIGMGSDCYPNQGPSGVTEITGHPHIESWYDGLEHSHWGWGVLIFFHKSNWVDIPNEIVVWFGDTFMKYINPNPKGVLRNFEIQTEMSTTVDLPEFNELKASDGNNWSKYFNHWKEHFSK